jgi:hypothetical protein
VALSGPGRQRPRHPAKATNATRTSKVVRGTATWVKPSELSAASTATPERHPCDQALDGALQRDDEGSEPNWPPQPGEASSRLPVALPAPVPARN